MLIKIVLIKIVLIRTGTCSENKKNEIPDQVRNDRKKPVTKMITGFKAVEGSRTLVSSLEGWGNEPLYDYRRYVYNI